jgi:hypothetical protein
MLNIQPKQWFQIISGSVSGLITGAALFQQLLGQEAALIVVAALGILNIVISSVGTALSGQAQLVKDVAAMPGVEKITVNAQANPTLAAVAVDQTVDKVSPTRQDMDVVTQTARGNN